MDFGMKMKVMRVVRGWTQDQLAENAGVSKPYVVLIERGMATPKDEYMQRLVNTLGITEKTEKAFELLDDQDGAATVSA